MTLTPAPARTSDQATSSWLRQHEVSNWERWSACSRCAREGKNLELRVHDIPEQQDQELAMLKLHTMGLAIDTLTKEQLYYRDDYLAGT